MHTTCSDSCDKWGLLLFIEMTVLCKPSWSRTVAPLRKWFEPRSYLLEWNLITQVKWVLRSNGCWWWPTFQHPERKSYPEDDFVILKFCCTSRTRESSVEWFLIRSLLCYPYRIIINLFILSLSNNPFHITPKGQNHIYGYYSIKTKKWIPSKKKLEIRPHWNHLT